MPKAKKVRLNPLGAAPSSLRKARSVTSAFHQLTHEYKRLAAAPLFELSDSAAGAASARKADIERRLEALGGRRAYQDASRLAVSQFKSSRHVFKLLTALRLRPARGEPALRTLEVGAINAHLHVPWLRVHGIDLLSRHPRIRQVDFFALKPSGDMHLVVNSMVVNCVDDARLRGRMLLLCFAHLRRGGHLFLNLPRRCVEQSKYLTRSNFETALKAIGFDLVNVEVKPKIILYCLQKPAEGGTGTTASASTSAAIAGRVGQKREFDASNDDDDDDDGDDDESSEAGEYEVDDQAKTAVTATRAPAFELPLFASDEMRAPLELPRNLAALQLASRWLQFPPQLALDANSTGTDFAISFVQCASMFR